MISNGKEEVEALKLKAEMPRNKQRSELKNENGGGINI